MQVRVKTWGTIQEIVGEREFGLELPSGAKVGNLLDRLVSEHNDKLREELYKPGTKQVRPYVKILVNGHGARPGNKLKDGDTVAIFPPVGGG